MEIEIPKRLKKRPMFRGVPIPFTAFIKPDGMPDFKVTNQQTWKVCVETKRCGLCGEKLLKGENYFIGGERSMASGVFYDPRCTKNVRSMLSKSVLFWLAKRDIPRLLRNNMKEHFQ